MSTNKIIRQIAKENGVTPWQVKTEMKKAIREAMTNKNPQVELLWKQIAPDGKEPSIDTFLKFCASEINKRKNL